MITRRTFLKGGMLLGGTLLVESLVIEPRYILRVERPQVRIRGLGADFAGFTVCQITDVHHSAFVPLGFVERVVDAANSLNPDLTVLTGDYVDMDREFVGPVAKALAGLRARHGVVSILGNHDYWAGRGYVADVLTSVGIPVLENSRVMIEKGGGALCVAGTEDPLEGRPDAAKSLSGVPEDTPRILLTHQPDYCEELSNEKDLRVDLALAGHTHGGQVRLPLTSFAPVLPSRYGQKYRGGLVRLKGGSGTQVYVSRGVGVVGLPVRFNCPPEITLLRLEAEEQKDS